MLSKDLEIHKDAMLLFELVDNLTSNMTKARKYSLGAKMFDIAMELPTFIEKANRLKGTEGYMALTQMLMSLSNLKNYNNYACHKKYTQMGTAVQVEYRIDIVAKQATAWRKSSCFKAQGASVRIAQPQ